MFHRRIDDRLAAIEAALTDLRATAEQLRASLDARFAPRSEIERLNLAFDVLAEKAPMSEVARLNEAFDLLGQSLEAIARNEEAVRRIEAGLDRRFGWRPRFEQSAFADAFRGSVEEIRSHYRDLADELAHHAPVLDIGCGRGEFLLLLEERGVEATGIDIDEGLVRDAVSRGLDVVLDDAVEHLRSLPNHSLGSVVLLQVIEHLSPQSALDVLSLTADKIRTGGRLVVETVNPTSLFVYTNAFYIDPTHGNPVHPSYLMFVLREVGFASAEIRWRSPVPDDQRLGRVEGGPDVLVAAINANVDRLNDVVFGPQDYAIVATR